MKKRMIAFVPLLLLMLLPVIGSRGPGKCTPLLYKVEDGAGHPLYLFGTIHVGDEQSTPWSEAVEKAYEEADVLAVEIDILDFMQDDAAMLSYSQALLYPNARDSARQHLSQEAYELGIQMLDEDETLLNRIRPYAWLFLAQEKSYAMAQVSGDYGADMQLLTRAHADGKRVDSLESMEEQMDMLWNQSDGFLEFQLVDMLRYPQESADAIRGLHRAWCNGDEKKLIQLLEAEGKGFPEQWQAEYAAYAHALYTERDTAFLQDALGYLESNETVFFAVGAAHIVRPGAVKDQLIQLGYTVTEIGR